MNQFVWFLLETNLGFLLETEVELQISAFDNWTGIPTIIAFSYTETPEQMKHSANE